MREAFDAKTFLREMGQRAIDDPDGAAGWPRGVRVVAASRALCAIDAIEPPVAQEIINEPLDRLLSPLEYSKGLVDALMDGPPGPGLPPSPVVVRDCSDELRFPLGRLYTHYAVFAEDYVGVEATAVGNLEEMHQLWHPR